MNPTDREFYPLHDAGNPASTASRRVLDLRPRPPREIRTPHHGIGINELEGGSRLRAIEPKPRTHEYHAGYAAGRRSTDRTGIFLAGYLSGVIVALGVVHFGSILLAGL